MTTEQSWKDKLIFTGVFICANLTSAALYMRAYACTRSRISSSTCPCTCTRIHLVYAYYSRYVFINRYDGLNIIAIVICFHTDLA